MISRAARGSHAGLFFSYFESKDDLMLAWQEASWNALCAELLSVSPDEEPLQAVRRTFLAYYGEQPERTAASHLEEVFSELNRVLTAK